MSDNLATFLAERYAEEWGAARDRELAQGLDESHATRDIDAKRAILALHEPELIEVINADGDERSGYWCRECDYERYPCQTVRLLSSPYHDHVGYQREWGPDAPSPR